jgi:hypothetical protein
MRALATRLSVVCLVWAMTPGLTEAVENAWHLASSGHTAHAPEAGEDHAPVGDEHGCSGTFHLCSCHHSPSTTMPSTVSTQRPIAAVTSRQRAESLHPGPELPGPFHPPQA